MKKSILLLMFLFAGMFAAISQTATLQIGTVDAPSPGSSVNVPVSLTEINAGNMVSFFLVINYDATKITATGTNSYGTLTPSNQWYVNVTIPGQVRAEWQSSDPNLGTSFAGASNYVFFNIAFTYIEGSSDITFDAESNAFDSELSSVTLSFIDGAVNGASSAPQAFSMTGGGSYCSTGSGVAVGLSDSETGVTYTLIKDSNPTATQVAGTGEAISFGLQTAGVYTASGANPGGTTPMTGSVTVTATDPVLPTFTQLGPYCVGATPGSLPTTSNNGITGTWNPSTISTASAGTTTYTFTPTAGQCATTATMDIVVNANVTPVFTQLGPYCVGATPGSLPTTSNNGITGTWNPSTISTASAGTTTYTFTPTAGQCATTATMDIVVNANVTPVFTQLGPYCVGATPGSLPTTSNNGITGTWNPSTISTASAGTTTYTFTPTAGQCATTATMDIVVNANVTPVFTQLGPYCVGATPGSLPTTSNNGITGTWDPSSISTLSDGTTTYTFTPSAGQCATTATMDIVVNANVTPVFTQLGPYCVGATPESLPTTSNNSINGTWNPSTISTASAGTTTYTFTPESGQCATTATMQITVNSQLTPSVTIEVDVNPSISGNTVNFTANPVNGGSDPDYSWYVNNVASGSNSASFSYIPVNGDEVYVMLTSSLTCVTQSNANSNTITMIVNYPATAVWTGSANDGDWNNANNWNSGVPGSTTNVTIPGGLGSNYPQNAGNCNDIVIENGASVLVNPVVNGTASVRSNVTADQYHYISSPVSAATAGSAFPGSTFMRIYNETDANAQWVNITENDILTPFTGYSTFIPAATGNQVITYSGVLNSGPFVNNGLTFTQNSTLAYDGYNLVGNPYASRLNLENGITRTNVDASIYFWNPSLNGGLGDYAVYTIGASGTNGASQYVAVGQGFFVKVSTPGTGSFGVSESSRSNQTQSFFKSVPASQIKIRIEGGVYSDETVVLFNQAATGNFDSEFDAFKLKASAVNHVYTRSTDEKELAINSLPSAEEFNVIPLYMEVAESNNYVLTASMLETLGSSHVWIEDMKTGVSQNLTVNPVYEFAAVSGDNAERFRLKLSALAIPENVLNSSKVWYDGENLRIDYSANTTGNVVLRNIAGQEVASFKSENQSSGSYKVACAPGMYLVSISTAEGMVTKKLVIK